MDTETNKYVTKDKFITQQHTSNAMIPVFGVCKENVIRQIIGEGYIFFFILMMAQFFVLEFIMHQHVFMLSLFLQSGCTGQLNLYWMDVDKSYGHWFVRY